MGESARNNSGELDQQENGAKEETRPQRGGEAETTRFGMEDGDNTDIPATGGAASNDSPDDRD